jgi:hypothetical protein
MLTAMAGLSHAAARASTAGSTSAQVVARATEER